MSLDQEKFIKELDKEILKKIELKASPKKNPVSDLKAMMIKEVPTATFMSILANRTKAGMIKNPPPAPMSPVTPPTKNPSIKING